MRTAALKCSMLSAVLIAATQPLLYSQTYSIDWFKIAGGGGTSTGGPYQISGTLGQLDASASRIGGIYSMVSGFWSPTADLETAAAPVLHIGSSGGDALIWWRKDAAGFVLETTQSLGNNRNWSAFTGSVNVIADQNTVAVGPNGPRFFRLRKP